MKKREQLFNKVLEEKKDMEELIARIQTRLAEAPEGSIVIKKHKKGEQFYRRQDSKDKNGRYIPANKKELAYKLIQRGYDEKLIREAKKQLKGIEAFLRQYDPKRLENVFLSMGARRRALLSCAEVPDEKYAEEWQKVSYFPKGFFEGTPEHYTQKGERVRSKSEVLIANALFQEGIPYRYECPLELGNQVIHPDFTILRLTDRQEIYWEHFGLLDDTAYRNDMMTRIDLYERKEIFPGDRLLITAETYKQPLNLAAVNRTIRHYLQDTYKNV